MMMQYSHPSATPYSSLPGAPSINALPQGIPRGPWSSVYRSAPGARIPAVQYPGMMGAGFGNVPGVSLVGALGQDSNGKMTKAEKFTATLFGAALSAGVAAGFAHFLRSRDRPVLAPALYMGGVSLAGGVIAIMLSNGKNGNGNGA
jgi:hypothetical protein